MELGKNIWLHYDIKRLEDCLVHCWGIEDQHIHWVKHHSWREDITEETDEERAETQNQEGRVFPLIF